MYATELQDALTLAHRLETFKADDAIAISYEERREISQKTVMDLENDDLLPIINVYTDKYKLAAFTLLRSARSFYSHSMRAKVDRYCAPFHDLTYSREKMVKFQDFAITKSLSRFKQQTTDDAADPSGGRLYRKRLQKLSIDIFRNILIFTDVVQTGNNRDKVDAARFVLGSAVSHCLLRDEVYAQILKQLDLRKGDNEDGVALILGFKLLYLCLCSFGSSQEMAMILLSRICLHCQPVPGFCAFRNVGEIAVNCLKAWRLMASHSGSVCGEMQRAMTDEEIGHILYSKAHPVRLEVYLPDDTRIRLKVHSFCTMAELIEMVCRRFGLSQWIKDFTLRIRANVEGFVVRTNSNLFSSDSQVAHWYGRWKDIVKKHPIMRWKIYVECHLKVFEVHFC